MVSRYAAAMARIKSWQHKLLQNKEAEKKDFSLSAPWFFSHLSISFSPSTTSIPLLAQHLTQGAVRGRLFFPPPAES